MFFVTLSVQAQVVIESYFPGGSNKKIYKGEKNMFIIKGLSAKAVLKMKHGWIRKIDATTYQIELRKCYKGNFDTLDIFTGNDFVDMKVFNTVTSLRPPKTQLVLGNDECWDEWTIDMLSVEPELKVIPESLGCKIDSFSISYNYPRMCDLIGPFIIKGNKLRGPAWDKIKKNLRKPPVYFYIDYVHVSNCSLPIKLGELYIRAKK